MRLIIESGSSKTEWRVVTPNGTLFSFSSVGLNPLTKSEEALVASFDAFSYEFALSHSCRDIKTIYCYSAGVVGDIQQQKLNLLLNRYFPESEIFIWSDLLAAARALYGNCAGVAAILGTGSNSCYYDGMKIVKSVPSGGFILGDEGSGAVLGRKLLSDFIREFLPKELMTAFADRYPDLSYPYIVKRVYDSHSANSFLASFVPFLIDHCDNEYVYILIKYSFYEFFDRNIVHYGNIDTLSFVGSVACGFSEILSETALLFDIKVGKIIKSPIENLALYHRY